MTGIWVTPLWPSRRAGIEAIGASGAAPRVTRPRRGWRVLLARGSCPGLWIRRSATLAGQAVPAVGGRGRILRLPPLVLLFFPLALQQALGRANDPRGEPPPQALLGRLGGGGAGLVQDRSRAGTEVFVTVAAARLANPGCLACRCNRSGRGCEPLVAGAWGHRKRAARATRAREGATTPKDLFEDTYPSFAPTNILFVSRDQKPSCGGDEPGRGCCSRNWSGYWPWRR
jgi:hypothetical protein